VNQFRVFLRAELGKLHDVQEASNFISAVRPPGLLKDLCLSADPAVLTRQLNSQAAVDELVARLSPQLVKTLSKRCGDDWRANPDLYHQLTSSDAWLEQEIEIKSIYLKQAEPDLRDVFAGLDYHLPAIATDAHVLSSIPYCYASPGDPVAYPVCLAKGSLGTYRIFDGMHRAIQLVRNGQQKIRICFSHDSSGQHRSLSTSIRRSRESPARISNPYR
jgi:hypothetical protein